MFGEQFYPTPEPVIQKMLAPYWSEMTRGVHQWKYEGYKLPKHILEPSAGKGDIINHITKYDTYNKPNFYAFEVDPNLQDILKQNKDVQLLGSDFLECKVDIVFDMIIMNPPFHNGATHLLKAWDILHSGDIICLLNSETINNPYTEERKLLNSIITKHGSVEDLGECFSSAERKTDVNVSLVRLKKVAERSRFDFTFVNTESEYSPKDLTNATNDVERYNVINSLIYQYENLKDSFVQWMEANQRLEFYAKGLLSSSTNVLEMAKTAGFDGKDSYNDFTSKLQHAAWMSALSRSGLEKFMTEKVRNNFNKFISEQGQLAFTKENIFQVIMDIMRNSSMILEQAIEDAFDLMTKHYSENRDFVPGWKTNDCWKINRKVILPYVIEYGKYDTADTLKRFGSAFSINYKRQDMLGDIDKCMCYILGKDFSQCTTIRGALDSKFRELGKICTTDKFENTTESDHFNIRFFKKGTLHIEFKDVKLLEQFNMRATKMKNWLPPKEWDDWKRRQNGETVTKNKNSNHSGLLEISQQTTLF